MKRVTLLCGMLLAITASVAAAGPGVNLRWSACLGDGGQINRNFACNTNLGNQAALVGSFELGGDLLQVSGNEIVVDLASASPALPSWWHFRNAGTCRSTSLSMNTTIGAAVSCFDWASGQAAGGIGAYNIGARGPNTARIVAATAVPASSLADLFGALEYFSFNLVINNAKTVGSGNCAGCEDPVCIVFNSINLTTPIAANNRKLTGPSNGFDADYATWQGGGGVIVQGVPGCGAATPTRSSTWGSVKSLYR